MATPAAPGQLFITQDCIGCQLCVELCPVQALTWQKGALVVGSECQLCLSCLEVCPADAIGVVGEK